MKKINTLLLLAVLGVLAMLLALPSAAFDLTITGDYVEARTSDVYTGPCFANGEVNLAGKEAVMAWQVTQGAWQGVDLGGLGVVAVVKASATLGDPHADPLPVRSVVVVDERANDEQRAALVELARFSAGSLLADVVAVQVASVDMRFDAEGQAAVSAGDVVALRTRNLNESDHLCGNEEIYYPPLSNVDEARPGVTLQHDFTGQGLDSRWKSPGKRSVFVGSFSY